MHQEPLEQRVLHFIQEHRLVSNQHRLLVAVSGGPDSVCLLHILVKLQAELDIRLHVAHLNHQLRGADAEADAGYVSDLAHHLGIPATIERRDVKAYQTQQHISLEEAAREVRYHFLANTAKLVGASRVAVGHTIDDHVETILMHLIRGTGTRGLRGLKPCSRWQSSGDSLTIIRPLLEVNHQETTGYCHHHRLMPRMDVSNLSLSPLRNRIRHQLLPLLESYNPRIAEALLRTGRIASDDLAFLDKEIARLWGEIGQKQENTIILDKERFLKLPSALKRNLLRTSVERLIGLKDIEARHIEEIMDALTKPAGKRLSLPGGLIFSIEYNRYLLGPDPAALSPFPILGAEFALKLPGKTLLPGWCIEATIIVPEAIKDDANGYIKGGGEVGKQSYKAYFDLNKTGNKLVVRSRQPGDRFQPLGMSQPKKLGEFMIDAKIPHAWRQRIPIVCSLQHILWVVGWRIDDRVRVTNDTKKILCLEFKRN
ncbi:MAG: tRNA lysidine(34) synthetase TilS [Dehalococcoidales bacterium]|nr:tRNA lysidine(34) synthetase TilS [Dehalococcoidales bacterium]